uniref:Reverse transcriptase domain-containing protein n=1 Tax=Tanacetum cinerariifolium TaxID=118510 RepID=A0A699KAM0_TANCI|nr:hypothetical protein [Tanacetum cinerariifolium]
MQPVAPLLPDYIPGPEEPHDSDYVPEPIYPEYIPLEDEHVFPVEEQPLPPVDSPTAESPGYVAESDPEEDPEEYENDETEDGSSITLVLTSPKVICAISGTASAGSTQVSLIPNPTSLIPRCLASASKSLEKTKKTSYKVASRYREHHPYDDGSNGDGISGGDECADGSMHLARRSPTEGGDSEVSGDGGRVGMARSLLTSASGGRGESSTARPTECRGIDYGFVSTLDADARQRGIREVGFGIRDTWVDPAEAVPEIAPITLGEDSRTHISQRVTMDSQRVDLLMEDRIAHQETILIIEEEAYAAREAWAHSIGLSQAVQYELQTYREQAELLALRDQPRRARQPGLDARVPDHQDASRDADSHI